MPELPEVEVTRLSMEPHVRDHTIRAVRLGKPLRWPLGHEPQALVGRTVGPLVRRGKYLWWPLLASSTAAPCASSPAPAVPGLLVHLGMSGSLRFEAGHPSAAPALGAHEHFELQFDHGRVVLTDPRRFGAVVWAPSLHQDPAKKLLSRLGLEPHDPALTPAGFHAALQQRRAPIKQVLLAGDVVVGAGNIYACEALFDAGIDPRLSANRLSKPRSARLLQAVQATLNQALALGGSTLRDFKDAHGMNGEFQNQARVYGREGQPCVACGGAVRRLVMGQRSTFFCPRCQRR